MIRYRLKRRRRVTAQMDSGRSYRGILLRCGRRWTLLTQVQVESDAGTLEDVRGQVWLPTPRIECFHDAGA